MKMHVTCLFAILGMNSGAFAGSLEVATASPQVVSSATPEESAFDGLYAGLQFANLDGSFSTAFGDLDFDGQVYGGFLGYRTSFGSVVVGGEVDLLVGQASFPANPVTFSPFDADVDRLIRVGGQAGYDFGRAIAYGTAGYANLAMTDEDGDSLGSGHGYFFGIGVDFSLTDDIIIGGEIVQHVFNDFDGGLGAGVDVEGKTIGLNVAYRF